MTMYLQHFGLREQPFSLTPDTSFFFAGSSYQAALNTLLVAARNGEGFVKIVGEVGNGKTLLCRKFLAILNQVSPVPSAPDAPPAPRFLTAYILNPYLEPRSLLLALSEEFCVPLDKDADQHQLLKGLTLALLECARKGQRALLGFEIGEQAQHFQAFQRHCLRLVQTHQRTLAFARTLQQRERQPFQQLVLIGILVQRHAKFFRQCQQQAARLKIGIKDIGSKKARRGRRIGCGRHGRYLIQNGEEFAAQQRLAIAHLADNLDEALAVARRHQQGVERRLITGAGKKEAGIRGQAERLFAQAKVL